MTKRANHDKCSRYRFFEKGPGEPREPLRDRAVRKRSLTSLRRARLRDSRGTRIEPRRLRRAAQCIVCSAKSMGAAFVSSCTCDPCVSSGHCIDHSVSSPSRILKSARHEKASDHGMDRSTVIREPAELSPAYHLRA